MHRRTSLIALTCVVAAVAALIAVPVPIALALPQTSSPTLTLARTIRTTPFINNASVSLHDGEGSAYVPSDNSLWLADDNGRAIYEVDPVTGNLKRTIGGSTFDAVQRLGGGSSAGKYRDSDLESLAYDQSHDILYAFSGKCCSSSELPTVFRLTRSNGVFQPDSYQALPSGSDYTASAWNPADAKVYVGVGSDLRTYDYVSNAPGSVFHVSSLDGILGMSFSSDGADLFVARKSTSLSRVNWSTKSLVSGWTFGLSSFGVKDSRAVELINDQFYVLDGYDGRKSGDPLRYGVFVFDVHGQGTAPTASFAASPTSGTAPLNVQFTDTSTGGPTSWSWTFGDGATSTTQNPSHSYAAGTWTATLTASNSGGSTSSSQQITVSDAPTQPTASFTASQTSGAAPLNVTFTDTSTGGPTSWSWTFGDGATSTNQNPSHSYAAGTWTATLTASNDLGFSSSSQQITVNDGSVSGTNLIGNPGFEADTTGWDTGDANVTLSRVAGGHSGAWSARLTNASAGGYCKLNDHPNWIATTQTGIYTSSAWVRADTSGASLKLRIVEYRSGTNVGSAVVNVTLTTSWQLVALTYTPSAPGASNLDFQAYTSSTPVGTCFYADDASITVT